MATKIEWVKNPDGSQGYTLNPVKGLCPMRCSYCYASRIYKRFKWDETVRPAITNFVDDLAKIKKPSRIFVGSTMELFGDWVQDSWMKNILEACELRPQHTFIFLTKLPQNLKKFSPFPSNVWIGCSATNWIQFSNAIGYLAPIQLKAAVKFISFEPLLERIDMDMMQKLLFRSTIDWIIIGQQTPISVKTQPQVSWIRELVNAADEANVKVFLKNNLSPLFSNINNQVPNILYSWWGKGNYFGVNLRQEFPEIKVGTK